MKNFRLAIALGILCAAAGAATHDIEAGSDWAVVPGLPYHLPRRGMRSVDIFQDDGDRELYLRLMREQGKLICYVPGILARSSGAIRDMEGALGRCRANRGTQWSAQSAL